MTPARNAARRAGLAAAAAAFAATAAPALAEPPPLPGAGSSPFLDGRRDGARASPVLPGLGLDGLLPLGAAMPPGAPGAQPPAWRVTPALGVQLIGTDNAPGAGAGRRADLITAIAPSLFAEADTAAIQGRLAYNPVARLYAGTSGQNRLDHQFDGQALATLLPERLYLDLRGLGRVQAIGGGYAAPGDGAGGGPVLDRRNQAQSVVLQASPYLVHRFGGLATAQVGYGFRYLSQTGSAAFLPGAQQPFFLSQETRTHEGYAVVGTGEDFGRLALESRTVGTVFDSDGVLEGAHRYISTLGARYALTGGVAALVEGGYEDLRFRGTSPLRVQGPVWAVGVRLAPDPDSVVVLKYGRRDGFDAAFLSAGLNLGVRTRLLASYTDRLGTPTLQAADLLASTTVDALGNAVNSDTGAPEYTPFGGSLLASQSSVLRQKRASLGIVQAWTRDTISLTATYDDRTPVTSAPGTTGFAQKGASIGVAWQRELAPTVTGLLAARYGRTQSAAAGDRDVYSLRAGLSRQLLPGLQASLAYALTSRGDVAAGGDGGVQNTVILALRQTF